MICSDMLIIIPRCPKWASGKTMTLDGDGGYVDAFRIGDRQSLLSEALEVEGDALADELFDLGPGLPGDAEPGKCGHVGAPSHRGALVDDAPVGHLPPSLLSTATAGPAQAGATSALRLSPVYLPMQRLVPPSRC